VGRVVSAATMVRHARRIQREGGRVVFTNGVFDLLHFGHVSYLQKARQHGSALFIGVNSDRSTRRLKGRTRPLVGAADRMGTLAALACVDFVTQFDEDTPAELMGRIKPDVLAKGADYKLADIVGAKEVVAAGGKIARIRLLKGRSTTALERRIRRSK
jgi:rfaE bifunctional protein nucleotidyltransferase chain/domain